MAPGKRIMGAIELKMSSTALRYIQFYRFNLHICTFRIGRDTDPDDIGDKNPTRADEMPKNKTIVANIAIPEYDYQNHAAGKGLTVQENNRPQGYSTQAGPKDWSKAAAALC